MKVDNLIARKIVVIAKPGCAIWDAKREAAILCLQEEAQVILQFNEVEYQYDVSDFLR